MDHGLTMHQEHKLRTVLWGWHGEPLAEEHLAGVERVLAALTGDLGRTLAEHVTAAEVDALGRRCRRLLGAGVMPQPREWPAVPWPPF